MSIYGPETGISATNLFDNLIAKIDAGLSGNDTGWNILKDARNPARVTGADGYVSFSSVSAGTPVLSDHKTNGGTSGRVNPVMAVKDQTSGVTYLFSYAAPSSGVGYYFQYATTLDGTNFTSYGIMSTNLGGSPVGGPFSSATEGPIATPSRIMADGTYWTVKKQWLSQPNGSSKGMMRFKKVGATYTGFTGVVPSASNGDYEDLTIGSSGLGYGRKINEGGHAFSFAPAADLAYYFFPSISGVGGKDYIEVLKLQGSTYHAAVLAADAAGDLGCRILFTADDLGVSNIYGVDYVVDKGSFYEIYVTVLVGSDYRTIMVRENNHDFFDPSIQVLSLANIYTAAGALRTFSVGLTDNVGQLSKVFATDYSSAAPLGDSTPSTIYAINMKASEDGNPDSNGLQYEYVVLKSDYTQDDGNGFHIMMLQLNPTQSSPPTVTGLTDRKPIFMRPIRNWDGFSPTRFYFDPDIPTGVDADAIPMYAPCIFTKPDPGASPAETHRIFVKATERQIFIHSESTNGTEQMLHCNILTPMLPLNQVADEIEQNDNIAVLSGGSADGIGCVYLGRNGFDETDIDNARLNGKPYYGKGFCLSYSSILNVENPVDGKTYAFDVIVGNNEAALDDTPVSGFSFLPGKLHGTKFYTDSAGVLTGDDVTILGVDYKVFKIDNVGGDNFNSVVPKTFLVDWSA